MLSPELGRARSAVVVVADADGAHGLLDFVPKADGQLLIGGNRSYDPLGDTGLALPLTGIGAFRDTGLLFGGVSGRPGYFSPETGF